MGVHVCVCMCICVSIYESACTCAGVYKHMHGCMCVYVCSPQAPHYTLSKVTVHYSPLLSIGRADYKLSLAPLAYKGSIYSQEKYNRDFICS